MVFFYVIGSVVCAILGVIVTIVTLAFLEAKMEGVDDPNNVFWFTAAVSLALFYASWHLGYVAVNC